MAHPGGAAWDLSQAPDQSPTSAARHLTESLRAELYVPATQETARRCPRWASAYGAAQPLQRLQGFPQPKRSRIDHAIAARTLVPSAQLYLRSVPKYLRPGTLLCLVAWERSRKSPQRPRFCLLRLGPAARRLPRARHGDLIRGRPRPARNSPIGLLRGAHSCCGLFPEIRF